MPDREDSGTPCGYHVQQHVKQIAARMQEGNIMLARLHFILSAANLFSPFLTKFQSECTSIHLLFEELAQILQYYFRDL